MKYIVQQYRQNMAMVTPNLNWPKCDFCGFCHSPDPEKCPRIKSFDKNFPGKKS